MLWVAIGFFVPAAANPQTQCAPCHARQVERHLASNHARTLRPVTASEFFKALPDAPIGEARGGFLLTYLPEGAGVRVTASRGSEQSSALIQWAFGAGDQGVTPVAKTGDTWIEHRISFYTKPGRFDLTLGHAPGASRSAAAAIGIEQPAATIRACFGCHSSSSPDLREIRPGVSCDRCHAGSLEHAAGKGQVTPFRSLDARMQLELCGECHRVTPPNGNHADPLNVRFQPLRLQKSKCFQKGNLGCVSCHPAHQNARRNDAAFYRRQCLSCHADQSAKGDCIECHMPKSTPAPYLAFTDHFIR